VFNMQLNQSFNEDKVSKIWKKKKLHAQSFCINVCSKLWVVLLYMDLHPPIGSSKSHYHSWWWWSDTLWISRLWLMTSHISLQALPDNPKALVHSITISYVFWLKNPQYRIPNPSCLNISMPKVHTCMLIIWMDSESLMRMKCLIKEESTNMLEEVFLAKRVSKVLKLH
jgi:hypothetical protein